MEVEGVVSRLWADTPVFVELKLVDLGLKRSIGDTGIAVCRGSFWVLMALGLICKSGLLGGVDGAEST
jgi:hypothetical protein